MTQTNEQVTVTLESSLRLYLWPRSCVAKEQTSGLFLSVLSPGELRHLRMRAASLSPGFPTTPLSQEAVAQDLVQYPQWKAGWVPKRFLCQDWA